MRKTRRLSVLPNRAVKRAEAERPDAGTLHEHIQEAGPDTYTYTTQAVFRDPKTGRRVPVNVGVVVSEGYIMTWLKT